MAASSALTIAGSHFTFDVAKSTDKTVDLLFMGRFVLTSAVGAFIISHVVNQLLPFVIVLISVQHLSGVAALLAKPLPTNAFALFG